MTAAGEPLRISRWEVGPVGSRVGIEVTAPRWTGVVAAAFDARAATPGDEGHCEITVGPDPDFDHLTRVGRPDRIVGCESTADVLRAISDAVEEAAARHHTDPVIHAATVSSGGPDSVAALIVGASGSGKSTLAVQCSSSGLVFHSDELVAIRTDQRVDPFTRPAHLRSGGPPIPGGWVVHRSPAGDVALPPIWGDQLPRAGVVVTLLRQDTHVGVTVESLSRASAARHLVMNGFNLSHLPSHGVPEIVRFVEQVPAFVLRYSDAREAAGTIATLLRNPPQRLADEDSVTSGPHSVHGRPELCAWDLGESILVSDPATTWVAAVEHARIAAPPGSIGIHSSVLDQIDRLQRSGG